MNVQQQEDLQKGLRYYQRARKYYAAGINRFKDTVVASFVRKANKEPGQRLDVKGNFRSCYSVRINQNNSSRFLKSIKGVRVAKTVDAEGHSFSKRASNSAVCGGGFINSRCKSKAISTRICGSRYYHS
jgi:Txe/YoeB family toxin of Txe-Axe toxin-antitoxin module